MFYSPALFPPLLINYKIKGKLPIAEGEGAAGQPSTCQNGGTYKTIQGKCECEPDYTGPNCETGQLRLFLDVTNTSI